MRGSVLLFLYDGGCERASGSLKTNPPLFRPSDSSQASEEWGTGGRGRMIDGFSLLIGTVLRTGENSRGL